MAGLNDDFFLADDSTEPKPPTVTVQAFKDTAQGDEPELRDDIDLIAAPATEELFIQLRDLRLVRESIRTNGGMSQSIALEAHAIMPEFINEERPVGFFTKMPSKTMLAAALEDIGKEEKSTVQRMLDAITNFIKQVIERIQTFFEKRQDEALTEFSEKTQEPKPQLIAWAKVGQAAGIEVPKEAAEEPAKDLNEVMKDDDSRKKAVATIADKLFIRMGEANFKRFLFIGSSHSKTPEEFIDFFRKTSGSINRADPKALSAWIDEVTQVIGKYRQEEAIFEVGDTAHAAREIMSDILYMSDHGYYKEHFKFKGAKQLFRTKLVETASGISKALAQVRSSGDVSEEETAKLKVYQEAVTVLQRAFQVYTEISNATDAFLKLRKQYMSEGASLSARPEV